MCEFEKALLKLACLLAVAVDLLKLLLVVYLVLEAPLHDVFADLLDALDEETLELVLLCILVHLVRHDLLALKTLLIQLLPQLLEGLSVVGLECLHVLDDLLLDVVLAHLRGEDQVEELAELSIVSRNEPIPAHWGTLCPILRLRFSCAGLPWTC